MEHSDGTMARYVGFNKNAIFVNLGQTVFPQTELGQLDSFNNAKYRLYFDVYYLKDIDFTTMKNRTLASENQTSNITPYFHSSDGPILLKNGSSYIVETNDEVLCKELSRKERRKLKQKGKP